VSEIHEERALVTRDDANVYSRLVRFAYCHATSQMKKTRRARLG